jgi:G3E family GTPase
MKSIPVWVIGGYLGSGKTTLLNAFLRRAAGVRFAVLVNDFGSLNIDADLIAGTGTETLELTNGCTCCTIGGDLILALRDLIARADLPDAIVIEASGVADPLAVARLAACHPALSVRGTIVAADAETIRERSDDKYVGGLVLRQLATAGVVVMSKIDLIDDEHRAETRAWIAETVPKVPVFESADGIGFPVEYVLDSGFIGDIQRLAAAGDGAHASAFASRSYRSSTPLDRARFLDAVRAMVPAIVRAKGTLCFSDDPEHRFVFQLAGRRWSLEPLQAGNGVGESRFVAISLASDEGVLADTINAISSAD